MTSSQNSEQLAFWRGAFGSTYIDRNTANVEHLRARVALWAQIMDRMKGDPPKNILEVGSNIGNNLRALKTLSEAELLAIEPNHDARQILIEDGVVSDQNAFDAFAGDIPLDDASVDMVFTSGVLIHIHPDHLVRSIEEIHRVSRRYIACVEYFSVNPEMIPYRGHDDRLFKRDFGGLYMDTFPDLRLVDYGFAWKRVTGLDNLTWWLFEKTKNA